MILSKAPLRISLFGSDSPKLYANNGYCQILSFAINQFVYTAINETPNPYIRISYSQFEQVENLNDIQHNIVREALKCYRFGNAQSGNGLEISSFASMKSDGSGLGSSSTFTIALLKGLMELPRYKRLYDYNNEQLAEAAFCMETEYCKSPIGKQDQYAAAFGGSNIFTWYANGCFTREPIDLSGLLPNLMLFKVGEQRSANEILIDQNANSNDDTLIEIRRLVRLAQTHILNKDYDAVGQLLNYNWELKKSLSSKISNSMIDDIYEKAMNVGALGGKLCGAGGSGFLLFYVPVEKQPFMIKYLGMEPTKFDISHTGAEIVYRS